MKVVQIFTEKKFGDMRCYIGNDNIIYLNVEDSAKGLGFVNYDKNGNKKITWDIVRNLLKRFNYNKKVKAEDYIPENIFYLLTMKADNESATNFQMWIANEVIPTIRRTGTYSIKPQVPQIAEQVQARKSQVQTRKEIVGVYELYSVYAKNQGDNRKPSRIYAKFSNLANRVSGIPNGCRELATAKQLKICEMTERIISQTLTLGISANENYKNIEESVMLKASEIMQLTSDAKLLTQSI